MSASEAMRLTMAATMETNHDLAVRYLREAIDQDRESVLPRFHLATILGARGLHAQAAAVLKSVVRGSAASDPGVRFLYARQLHLAGDFGALEHYEAALILDPACEKAHLYLAQLLAPGDDPNAPAAAEHAAAAIRLRPDSSMVPASEFVETYEAVLGAPPGSEITSSIDRDFSSEAIGRLMLLHPGVNRVLEEAGIQCAECAGYSTSTLRAAALDVGADLSSLNAKLTMIAGGESHDQPDNLEAFVRS
jgi:tetratricopeptide (TPR) repeat protein